MKIINIFLLLVASTSAVAAEGPWYNDADDCRRHWADAQEGCRIRQGRKTEELASIDIDIQTADSARDAAVAPKQAAAETYARLDEKRRDREEVFIPYLKRTVVLLREMHGLLIGTAAKELSRIKSLIEFVSFRLPDESPEPNALSSNISAAGAAALTFETSDALALSLILDSSLEDKISSASSEQQAGHPRTITFGFILDKIEMAAEKVEQIHYELARQLGGLTGENELELVTQERQLETLKTETVRALEAKAKTEKDYSDAVSAALILKARKSDLPRDIRSEELNRGIGLQYYNSDCQKHFSSSTNDRGHGGGGRL